MWRKFMPIFGKMYARNGAFDIGPAQGTVHCHQLKSLDWRAQNVRIKEAVPQSIVDEALARIEAILFE